MMVTRTETPLIMPEGKKKGCLLRRTAFGKVFAPMAEKVKLLEWDEIRRLVHRDRSNRRHIWYINDQDGVGSCGCEQTAKCIETLQAKAGQLRVPLNPLSIYNTTAHGRDNGSSLDENWEFARTRGCLPEAVWPRSKGWREDPPEELWDRFGKHFRLGEGYDIGSTQETATALIEQYVVGFGWDGHSCMLDHLFDENLAEYANSWDRTWGDEGFGTIRLRSINYGYGCLAARTATVCPQRVLDDIVEYAQQMGYANVG
jgi:hypothetical protein